MNKLTIEVGGKSYPCRLTMGAMLLFKQQTGKDVRQLTDGDLEGMLVLMWCCMKSACRADGIAMDIDFDHFCDLIGPADMAKWNIATSTASEDGEKKSEGQ